MDSFFLIDSNILHFLEPAVLPLQHSQLFGMYYRERCKKTTSLVNLDFDVGLLFLVDATSQF